MLNAEVPLLHNLLLGSPRLNVHTPLPSAARRNTLIPVEGNSLYNWALLIRLSGGTAVVTLDSSVLFGESGCRSKLFVPVAI
jgi:hypothetical protein